MRMANNYVELRWRKVPGGPDRFWKAVMKGNVLTLTEGEMGTRGESETRTFPGVYEARDALQDEGLRKADEGYNAIPPKEMTKRVAAATKRQKGTKPPVTGSGQQRKSPERGKTSVPKSATSRKKY